MTSYTWIRFSLPLTFLWIWNSWKVKVSLTPYPGQSCSGSRAYARNTGQEVWKNLVGGTPVHHRAASNLTLPIRSCLEDAVGRQRTPPHRQRLNLRIILGTLVLWGDNTVLHNLWGKRNLYPKMIHFYHEKLCFSFSFSNSNVLPRITGNPEPIPERLKGISLTHTWKPRGNLESPHHLIACLWQVERKWSKTRSSGPIQKLSDIITVPPG